MKKTFYILIILVLSFKVHAESITGCDYADKILKQAKNISYGLAYYSLGIAFFTNKYCKRDYEKALKWFKLSAKEDYHKSYEMIFYHYKYGYGVAKNYASAGYWLKKAEKRGVVSYFNLGNAYIHGYFAYEINIPKGLEALKKGADMNEEDCLMQLAYYYYYGELVKKDYKKALKYASKCGDMGNPCCIALYANAKYRGNFIKRNLVDAYKLYLVANEVGYFEHGYMTEENLAETRKNIKELEKLLSKSLKEKLKVDAKQYIYIHFKDRIKGK